jgi:hypothetical protein
MHRLIAGTMPGQETDHRNGNPLDNRRANLRPCRHNENLWNQGVNRRNSTGYKGVYLDQRRGKYVARIRLNNRYKHLGQFNIAQEAADVYDAAAIELHGEFALTNKMMAKREEASK